MIETINDERKQRLKAMTTGCPCDDCPQYRECADTGKACYTFSFWVRTGKNNTAVKQQRQLTALASCIL